MSELNKRIIARVLVETVVPLAVGTGEASIMTDSEVAVDYNGMPYIPGTSLTGVLRNAVKDEPGTDRIFGSVSKENLSGSMIIVSDAKIVDLKGRVVDGCALPDPETVNLYKDLPVRQHVKIGNKGAAEDTGKFDNQVVYKGTRFCFDLECMILSSDDETLFYRILDLINSDALRIGGGTRKGYGRLEAKAIWVISYDMTDKEAMDEYLEHSAELSIDPFALQKWTPYTKTVTGNDDVINIRITPEDFVFFGSGFGNENADAVQLMERYVVWHSDHEADVRNTGVVIPASSVKGTFAHRFEYWYNVLERGKGCKARNALFGYVDNTNQCPGVIFFDDVIEQPGKSKVFNHVKIDRFTGGAFPGALYNEEAMYLKGREFTLTIRIDSKALKARCADADKYDNINYNNILKAAELVKRDIEEGLLPLGGLTNRGHGCFTHC